MGSRVSNERLRRNHGLFITMIILTMWFVRSEMSLISRSISNTSSVSFEEFLSGSSLEESRAIGIGRNISWLDMVDQKSHNLTTTPPTNTRLDDKTSPGDLQLPNLTRAVEGILLEEIQNTKERALEHLMKIFDLSSSEAVRRDKPTGPPPEFMIDLYNTITDSYGIPVHKNPYDAHIVRSFIERDNSLNDFFYFNISGLSQSEVILEAELHIHRMPMTHETLHPSLHLTPFYILSLYQVLDSNQLNVPDLHKLLSVQYVPALGSGWEVFNVKQAVLDWMNGKQGNHGFLISATSLSGDRVPIRFSRRGESIHSKQPILVLFNEDKEISSISDENSIPPNPNVLKFKKSSKDGDPIRNEISNGSSSSWEREEAELEQEPIPTSSLENPRFHHALLFKDSIRHPNSVSRFRSRRSKNHTFESIPTRDEPNQESDCKKRDLLVNFEAIGWSSWIISPKGYNAFHCDGQCRFPLGQQMKPTNHATVQSIVHELKLAPGVQRPCCVPTKLLPISLLYYDDQDNVVMKRYVDMVAESCGCH